MTTLFTSQIRAIMWKDLREVKNKATTFGGMLLLPLLLLFANGLAAYHAPDGVREQMAQALIDGALTHHAMSLCLLVMLSSLNTAFVQERLTGTLEFVLSTHLPVRSLWLGKSLLLLCFGCCTAFVGSALLVVETHLLMVAPAPLQLPSVPALVFLVLLMPPTAFAICLVVGALQLLSVSPVLARVIYMLTLMAYMAVSSLRQWEQSFSWSALGPYVAILSFLVLAALALGRRLDRERVAYAR